MSWFTLLVLTALVLVMGGEAIEVLSQPHSVSGRVWHDWNNDGIRQDMEPAFPYVKVTLLYQTTEQMKLLTSDEPELVEMQEAFTLSDGTYHFSCLTAGYYAVRFYTPENRPSIFAEPNAGEDDMRDSDVTNNQSNRTGTTDLFLAEDGGSSYKDLGLYQFIFMNQYSMSGHEAVPSAPATTNGVVYSVLNLLSSELYYRVLREEWKNGHVEESAGFYEGWAGTNGPIINSLSDRSEVKENVWFIPEAHLDNLYTGKVYTLMIATGSFSDLGRLRGQFYNFRSHRQVSTSVVLKGTNVTPSVSTSAMAVIDLTYNIDSPEIQYHVHLEGFGTSEVTSIGIYGPADRTTTGDLLVTLMQDETSVDVSEVENLDEYFLTSQLYVQVSSSAYPMGHVRGQINQPLPVVYQTIFNLTSHVSALAYGQAAFTLDWRKAQLYYYIYFEGVKGDEVLAELVDMESGSSTILDGEIAPSGGNAVKQGYFFNLSEDQMDSLAMGNFEVIIQTTEGIELTGNLRNWF